MARRTVMLKGGYNHGKTMAVLHGSSVRLMSTGETYARPSDPAVHGDTEVWPLTEFDGDVIEGRAIPKEISDLVAQRMKRFPPIERG